MTFASTLQNKAAVSCCLRRLTLLISAELGNIHPHAAFDGFAWIWFVIALLVSLLIDPVCSSHWLTPPLSEASRSVFLALQYGLVTVWPIISLVGCSLIYSLRFPLTECPHS